MKRRDLFIGLLLEIEHDYLSSLNVQDIVPKKLTLEWF